VDFLPGAKQKKIGLPQLMPPGENSGVSTAIHIIRIVFQIAEKGCNGTSE
jgi:hypothetical protein